MLPGTVPAPNDSGLLNETRLILGKFTSGPSLARAFTIDALIRALKANGTWAKRSGLWVHAAHGTDGQSGLINWINPGSLTLSINGSPTFTADRGFTGNGTDGFLSGGNLTSAYPLFLQDDSHVMGWSLIDVTSSNTNNIIGSSSATGALALIPEDAGSKLRTRFNDVTTDTATANTDPRGLYTLRRNNSANYQQFKDATQVGSVSVASTGISSASLRILGNGANRSMLQIAMTSIGGALTDTEIANDHAALHAYLTAVGAV